MITVTVSYHRQEIVKIELKGHADYAASGSDLVCAGASCCFVGALNALEHPEGFTIDYEEGDGTIEAQGDVNSHDQIVLEVMFRQLETIADNYPKNMKIITERR